MNKLRLSRLLMTGTIVLIAAFQFYWLKKLYNDEEHTLLKTMDVVFRESMYKIQAERFKADSLLGHKASEGDDIFIGDVANFVKRGIVINATGKHGATTLSTADSSNKEETRQFQFSSDHPEENELSKMKAVTIVKRMADSTQLSVYMDSFIKAQAPPGKQVQYTKPFVITMQGDQHRKDSATYVNGHSAQIPISFTITNFLSGNKTLNDSIPVKRIDSTYTSALLKNGIALPYTITKDTLRKKDTTGLHKWQTSQIPVGFMTKTGYQATFDDPSAFLFKKIRAQIILSFLLLVFTTASFIFLYRNLLVQRQIALMKNDLISNITHELKTPIATVTVAIEALRNFGGIQSPERTKEYLDMSASELQRLSLLVDNVLRFSLFENKEIALQKEPFDLLQLTQEVMASMKLQFEKHKACTSLETTGEHFVIEADKLHITSVIYNLLDNALKYSKEDPSIIVRIIDHTQFIELQVNDNGIGIADQFRHKIFEQFFRVPGDDRHNVKGYGLGLSYVSHIVKRHQGFIEVKSELGKGSTFSVKLPFKEAPVIYYDKDRRVVKKTIKLRF